MPDPEALTARLAEAVNFLPDKPEETPESTLRALWLTAAGQPASAERAMELELPELDADQTATLETLIAQRIEGVPLAHLTGRQRFMGIELLAGPEALIPRKETELLGHTVLGLLDEMGVDAPLVIDVCTGAGNLPIAYARHHPGLQVLAADLSPEAVDLARRNVGHMELEDRIELGVGDLLEPFDSAQWHGRIDVLSCNPPYISSGKVEQMDGEIAGHEPRLAFDGGPFGVSIVQRLIQDAPRFLRPGGWLVFEVGLGQGPVMARRLGNNPDYEAIRTTEDTNGDIRVIAARRAPA